MDEASKLNFIFMERLKLYPHAIYNMLKFLVIFHFTQNFNKFN